MLSGFVMRAALMSSMVLGLAGCAGDDARGFGRDDPLAKSPAVEFSPAAYPPPPYGTRESAVIQNREFVGWTDAKAVAWDPARFEKVSLSDFYDAGASDVRFLFVTVVEVWCPWCREIYSDVKANDRYPAYREQGVEFLGVLTEDANRAPATPADLVVWARDMYAVTYPMVIDPGFKMDIYHDSAGTPLSMLIDARDMRILFKMNGVPNGSVAELFARIDDFIAQ